jgi:hypothetical protein
MPLMAINMTKTLIMSDVMNKLNEDSYSQQQRRSAMSPFPWQCNVYPIESIMSVF